MTSTKLQGTRKDILKLAVLIFNSYSKQWREYEEACEAYARQGYRPHYCFHGRNMWHDYDISCGACEEDGYSFDPTTYRRYALDESKRAFQEQDERIQMLIDLMQKGAPVQVAELGAWATEPVQRYYPKAEQKVGYAALAELDPPF